MVEVNVMEKEKYYVNIATGEISQNLVGNNQSYTIYANLADLSSLRIALNRMHEGGMSSFWRSHIPIMSYHHDSGNDQYDANLNEVFSILYECGDAAAREHIANFQLGINGEMEK